MNENYNIQPYKDAFQEFYNKFLNASEELKLQRFEDLLSAVQVGSGTNQTRVNAIKDFETKRIINAIDYFVKQNNEEFYNKLDVLSEKLRFDIYLKVENYLSMVKKNEIN